MKAPRSGGPLLRPTWAFREAARALTVPAAGPLAGFERAGELPARLTPDLPLLDIAPFSGIGGPADGQAGEAGKAQTRTAGRAITPPGSLDGGRPHPVAERGEGPALPVTHLSLRRLSAHLTSPPAPEEAPSGLHGLRAKGPFPLGGGGLEKGEGQDGGGLSYHEPAGNLDGGRPHLGPPPVPTRPLPEGGRPHPIAERGEGAGVAPPVPHLSLRRPGGPLPPPPAPGGASSGSHGLRAEGPFPLGGGGLEKGEGQDGSGPSEGNLAGKRPHPISDLLPRDLLGELVGELWQAPAAVRQDAPEGERREPPSWPPPLPAAPRPGGEAPPPPRSSRSLSSQALPGLPLPGQPLPGGHILADTPEPLALGLPDPDEARRVADLVNEALLEQARRHGVDLS